MVSSRESAEWVITKPPSDTKCHLALSIILDDSGSVGAADFDKELVFARAIIEIVSKWLSNYPSF